MRAGPADNHRGDRRRAACRTGADTDRDRIFTPEQAVEYGLVDQLVAYRKQPDDEAPPVQAASRTSAVPSELESAARR